MPLIIKGCHRNYMRYDTFAKGRFTYTVEQLLHYLMPHIPSLNETFKRYIKHLH